MRPEQPLQEQDTTLRISLRRHVTREQPGLRVLRLTHAPNSRKESNDVPASKSFQTLNPRFLPNHYRFRSPPQEKSGGSPHFRISDGCLLPPRELRPIRWEVGIFISSLPQEDYEGGLDGISGEPASRMTSVSIMANETQDKPNWGEAQLWKEPAHRFTWTS